MEILMILSQGGLYGYAISISNPSKILHLEKALGTKWPFKSSYIMLVVNSQKYSNLGEP